MTNIKPTRALETPTANPSNGGKPRPAVEIMNQISSVNPNRGSDQTRPRFALTLCATTGYVANRAGSVDSEHHANLLAFANRRSSGGVSRGEFADIHRALA